MLAPFGEERKCAYRLMAEFAASASRDFAVMRFDYSGTGESTGDHAESTLASWVQDVKTAVTILRERAAVNQLVLLGARLGGNLALQLQMDGISRMVLWEPLVSGRAFLDELLRRKQIKEMMGGGSAESLADEAASAWDQGAAVDFDGFEVGPAMAAELREMDLTSTLARLTIPTLLLHVSSSKRLTGEWLKIQETLVAKKESAFQLIHQKPFWGLADYQEHREIKGLTATWLGPDREGHTQNE